MAILGLLALVLGLAPMTLVPERVTTAETSSGRPALTIAAVKPVTIVGRGFLPAERIRVTVDGYRKTVTAGPRGGFKVVFPRANACNGFAAVARGSEGSRASVAFASVHCVDGG
jgi:hypothetical protein